MSVKVLLDCGSEVAMISECFVMLNSVPKVQRDVPSPGMDVAKRIVPGSGNAYSFPLRISFNDHVAEDTFVISLMEETYDIILPAWWMAKHPCVGYLKG